MYTVYYVIKVDKYSLNFASVSFSATLKIELFPIGTFLECPWNVCGTHIVRGDLEVLPVFFHGGDGGRRVRADEAHDHRAQGHWDGGQYLEQSLHCQIDQLNIYSTKLC